MDDIKQLTPFVEVARSGSFAAAAKKLGVTASAISKSIAHLERHLGVRLMNRTTRRLHLTAEGDKLFSRVSVLLAGLVEAVNDAREDKEQPVGRLRVSIGATFGRYSLIPALAAFLREHPRVQLELSFDDAPGSLVERGFDLGIHHGHGSETTYVSRVLCDYPLLLVASPDYLARKGVPQKPADLVLHDCVGTVISGALSNWVLEAVHAHSRDGKKEPSYCHKLDPRLSISSQWDIGLTTALHGVGIAPTSLPAALQFLKQDRLKVVLPDYRLHNPNSGGGKIYVLYPHREYLASKVRVFVDFLIAWFRSHAVEALNVKDYAV